jgi:hypothetical protein
MKTSTIDILKKFIEAHEKGEELILNESDGFNKMRMIKNIINVMESSGEKVNKYNYYVNAKYNFVINID